MLFWLLSFKAKLCVHAILILTAGQWLPLAVILPTSTGAQGTSVCLSACVCVCTSSIFPHVLLSGPAQLFFFFLFFSSLLLFFYRYRFSSGCSDLLSLFRIHCSSSLKSVSFVFKGHLILGNHPDNQTNSGTGVKVSPVSEDRKVLMHQFKETLES